MHDGPDITSPLLGSLICGARTIVEERQSTRSTVLIVVHVTNATEDGVGTVRVIVEPVTSEENVLKPFYTLNSFTNVSLKDRVRY